MTHQTTDRAAAPTARARARLGHVGVHTPDLDRFRRFYEDVLGLRLVAVDHPTGAPFRRMGAFTDRDGESTALLVFEIPGYSSGLADDVIGRRGARPHRLSPRRTTPSSTRSSSGSSMPARHPARSTTSDPSGPCCSSIPTARTTTCRSSSRDGARGRGPRSSTQTCSPVCSASTRGSAMTEAPREAEFHLLDRARRTGQWSVVSGASRARFHVRDKLVATVHGSRPITSGVVLLSDGGTVMQARLDLDVQGIDTGNRRRDRDLQKPQFLAATTSPSVTVSVTGVTSSATGWTATAVVHARGHSAPLDLAVQTLVVYGELADPPDDEVRILAFAGRLDRAPLGIKVPRMSSSADSSTSRRTWCSAGTGTTSPATTRNCTTGRRCPRERRVPAAGCAGRRTPRRGPRAGRCGRSRQLSARRAAGHRARFRPVTEPPVAPEVRTLTFRRAASRGPRTQRRAIIMTRQGSQPIQDGPQPAERAVMDRLFGPPIPKPCRRTLRSPGRGTRSSRTRCAIGGWPLLQGAAVPGSDHPAAGPVHATAAARTSRDRCGPRFSGLFTRPASHGLPGGDRGPRRRAPAGHGAADR